MPSLTGSQRLAANRPLASLVGASALSGIGDWLYLTALPVVIWQATEDAALVGLAAAGRLVPFFLLSMPAGLVADRLPQRSILLVTEVARALLMVVLAGLCWAGADTLLLLACALAAAAAGTFAMPAQGSLVPRLARDNDELGWANTAYSTLDSVAAIVGPAIAGVLIVAGGLPAAFLINAATFGIIVVVLFTFVPGGATEAPTGAAADAGPSEAQDDESTNSAEPGFREIARTIWRTLALDGAVSFAAAALSVLAVAIAVDHLGASAGFSGALNAALGIGGVAGGLATAAFVNRDVRGGVVVGVVVASVAVALMATTASPILCIGLMAVAAGAFVLLDALNTTTIQRLSAGGFTGRAIGLVHTLAAAWMVAGSLLPGIVAATLGVGAAVVLVAVIVAALGAISVMPLARLAAPDAHSVVAVADA